MVLSRAPSPSTGGLRRGYFLQTVIRAVDSMTQSDVGLLLPSALTSSSSANDLLASARRDVLNDVVATPAEPMPSFECARVAATAAFSAISVSCHMDEAVHEDANDQMACSVEALRRDTEEAPDVLTDAQVNQSVLISF